MIKINELYSAPKDIKELQEYNPEYKEYSGENVSIKNSLKGSLKDLVIEGKTIGGYNAETQQYETIVSCCEGENNVLKVKTSGKNFFDNSIEATTVEGDVRGGCYKRYRNTLVEYDSTKEYCVTYKKTDTNHACYCYITCFDKELNMYYTNINTTTFGKINKENTIKDTPAYISVDIRNVSLTSSNTVAELNASITDVQIEEGTIATSYAPYVEAKAEVQLPCSHKSLPNKISNEYFGESGKYAEMVGKINYIGDEDFKKQGADWDTETTISFYMKSPENSCFNWWGVQNPHKSGHFICDKFASYYRAELVNQSVGKEGIGQDVNRIVFSISRSKLESQDVAGFRKWLQANPTTVIYELAMPIVHNIEKLKLNAHNESTYVTQDNSISGAIKLKAPVNIDAIIEGNTDSLIAHESKNATHVSNGHMSIEDKKKLDELDKAVLDQRHEDILEKINSIEGVIPAWQEHTGTRHIKVNDSIYGATRDLSVEGETKRYQTATGAEGTDHIITTDGIDGDMKSIKIKGQTKKFQTAKEIEGDSSVLITDGIDADMKSVIVEGQTKKYQTAKIIKGKEEVIYTDGIDGKTKNITIEGNTKRYQTADIIKGEESVLITDAIEGATKNIVVEGQTKKYQTAKIITGEDSVTYTDGVDGEVKDIVVKGNTMLNMYRPLTWSSGTYRTATIDWLPIGKEITFYAPIGDKSGNTTDAVVNLYIKNTITGERVKSLFSSFSNNHGTINIVFALKQNEVVEFSNFSIHGDNFIKNYPKIMILEGNYIGNQIPSYFEGIQSTYEDNKIKILSHGKNLNSTTLELGDIANSSGQNSPSQRIARSKDFVSVRPSTTYKIEYVPIESEWDSIFFYDKNKNFISFSNFRGTKTTPSNCYYIKYKIQGESNINVPIQIEEGTITTPFEPYICDKKEILSPCPHRKLNVYDGKTGKYVENSGQIVLNGSESYRINADVPALQNTIAFFYQPSNYKRVQGLCDKFKNTNSVSVDEENLFWGGGLTFRILKSKLETLDVAGFKKWLQANPTTVVYELETPIQYNIEKLSLNSYKGHTTVLVDDIIPSNSIEVAYPIEHIELGNEVANQYDTIMSSCEGESNVLKVRSCGKNLFDGKLELGSLDGEGNNQPSTTRIRPVNYINLLNAKQIIISCSVGGMLGIRIYDENKKNVRTSVQNFDANNTLKVTLSENEKYLRWSHVDVTDVNTKYQIEQGIIATDYEPYVCDKKEILLPFDGGLKRIPDVCDEIKYNNINQKVGFHIIKDSDYMGMEIIPPSTRFKFKIPGSKTIQQRSYVLCDRLKTMDLSGTAAHDNMSCFIHGGSLYVYINNDTNETAQIAKDFMRGATIIYELETPITHNIEKISLNTYPNHTKVETENKIPCKSIEVAYPVKEKEVDMFTNKYDTIVSSCEGENNILKVRTTGKNLCKNFTEMEQKGTEGVTITSNKVSGLPKVGAFSLKQKVYLSAGQYRNTCISNGENLRVRIREVETEDIVIANTVNMSFTIKTSGIYLISVENNGNTVMEFSIENLMIEEGTLATDYVPYVDQKVEVQLPCPHREWNSYNGETGEYTDYSVDLTIDSCLGNAINQDEKFAWKKIEGLIPFQYFTDSFSSDKLYVATHNKNDDNIQLVSSNSNGIWVVIPKRLLQTIDVTGFDNYLKSNPRRIIYKRKIATVHNIEKISLNSYKNHTKVGTENTIPCSNIEVAYPIEHIEIGNEVANQYDTIVSCAENENNVLKVRTCGKNLCEKEYFYNQFYDKDKNGILKSTEEGRKCFVFKQNSFYWKKGYEYNFLNNTRYTLSFVAKNTSGNSMLLAINYTDGSSQEFRGKASMTSFEKFSITTHSNKTIKFIGGAYTDGLNMYVDSDTIQIEEGTIATSYEPYQEAKAEVQLPFGNGIKSVRNEFDTVYLDEGKVIQRNGYVKLTESEFILNGSNSKFLESKSPLYNCRGDVSGIFSHLEFKTIGAGSQNNPIAYFITTDGRIRIKPFGKNDMTLQEGLTWIADNNPTFIYQFKEPIHHNIEKLPLKNYKDHTKVENTNSLPCSKIKVAYPIERVELGNEVVNRFDIIKSCGEKEDNKLLIKTSGKNLFDVNGVTLGESLYGYKKISEKEFVITLKDKDTNVDLKSVYFGTSSTGVDATGGVNWMIAKGDIKTLSATSRTHRYISLYPNTTETLNILFKRFYIQIEEGSTATDYTPYGESKAEIQLPCPHRSLNIYDGENGKYIENSRQALINKEECKEWIVNPATKTIGFYFNEGIHENNNSIESKIICNNFIQYSTSFLPNNDTEGFCNSSIKGRILFRVLRSRLETQDVAGFKKWLQANPTIVVYELETPVIHNIDKTSLSHYKEYTKIETENTIPCSEIKTMYPIKEAEVEEFTNRFDILKSSCEEEENKLIVESYGEDLSDKDRKEIQLPCPHVEGNTYDGEAGTYTERYKKVILSSEWRWAYGNTGSGWNQSTDFLAFYCHGHGLNNKTGGLSTCDKFTTVSGSSLVGNASMEAFSLGTVDYIILRIDKKKLQTPDSDGLKKWLQENPTTVIYELKDPIVHNVDKASLKTYDNITNISQENLICGPTRVRAQVSLSSQNGSLLRENKKLKEETESLRSDIRCMAELMLETMNAETLSRSSNPLKDMLMKIINK